ncbi:MAG TPA: hypothetical protein VN811_15605, partial [Thermoanaerobaculia bacterium]|nr:hypothetical protein [Thermoanaerobaculia bacterium]
QAAVEAETSKAAALDAELEAATAKERGCRDTKLAVVAIGWVVAVGAAMATWWAFLGGRSALGAAMVVALILDAVVASKINKDVGEELSRASAARGRARHELDETRMKLRESTSAHELIEIRIGSLRRRLAIFGEAIRHFEKAATVRLAFSPAVSRQRARVGDIARVDPQQMEKESLRFDAELLPPPLRFLAEDCCSIVPGWVLAKRLRTSGGDVFSRGAVYFQKAA